MSCWGAMLPATVGRGRQPQLAMPNWHLANTYGSGRGIQPLPPFGPGANFPLIDNQSYQHVELYGIQAEANWDVGFATLTVIPSYRHVKKAGIIVEPGFFFSNTANGHQQSLELRLASPSGQAFKWMLGGYELGDSIQSNTSVNQGVGAQTQRPHQTGKSYSAFGDATYSVTSSFRLTGGLRYTSETKDQTGTALVQTFVVPAGPFAPPTPLPPFAQNFNYTINGHLKNDNVSGRASVEFDASAHNLLYATYSTGFKSGGFNPNSAPNTYRPEKLIAYTLRVQEPVP